MSIDKRMVDAVKRIAESMPNNQELMLSINDLEKRNEELQKIETDTINHFLDDDHISETTHYKFALTKSDKTIEKLVEEHNDIILNAKDIGDSVFNSLLPDQLCIDARTGTVVVLNKDDTVRIVNIDTNYRDLYASKKKMMDRNHELSGTSPFKIIERDSKAEAYRKAYTDYDWFVLREVARVPELKDNPILKSILSYTETVLRERYESHYEFINKQPLVYNTSTQSFTVRQLATPKEFDLNKGLDLHAIF